MKLNKIIIAVLIMSGAVCAQTPLPPQIANLTKTDSDISTSTNATIPDISASTNATIPDAEADTSTSEKTNPQEKTTAEVIPPPEISAPQATTDDSTDFIVLPIDSAPIDGITATNADQSNLITISLDDVAMEDVVRMFSRISNANIIATPSNLTARVTANLDGVEWKPALTSILSMHNLALTEKPVGSGVYSIMPRAADAPEPLVVETVFLEYTTVVEVTPVIQSMLPDRGSLSTFTSRNALVIRSTADNISEIKSVIKDIDIQSKQICIEALFMELNDSAIKQLGIRWDALGEFKVGVSAGPFATKETVNRTQSRDDSLSQKNNRSSVDLLDQKFDEFGVPFVETPPSPTRTITDTIDASRNYSSDIKDTFTKTIEETQSAILNVDTLEVVLSALKQTAGVSVVSNPKMIVANGATNAFFRVGSREPITKTSVEKGTQDSPGNTYTTELDTGITTDFIEGGYAHTGIELKVIPTVKTDNLIEALIEPSLRRKTDDKVTRDPESQVILTSYPVISVKEIKTRFTLESGQTVAIGGLTDTTKNKVTSKIPLLGDIPLLGKYLFSHTKDIQSQTETIIFVTLTIANPRNLLESAAIPEHAILAQKRRIQDKLEKHRLDLELEKLNEAAEQEIKNTPLRSSAVNGTALDETPDKTE